MALVFGEFGVRLCSIAERPIDPLPGLIDRLALLLVRDRHAAHLAAPCDNQRETPMTEPTPMTLAELNQAIIDASRELTAAIRAVPRDQQRIDDARRALEDLRALKAELYPAA